MSFDSESITRSHREMRNSQIEHLSVYFTTVKSPCRRDSGKNTRMEKPPDSAGFSHIWSKSIVTGLQPVSLAPTGSKRGKTLPLSNNVSEQYKLQSVRAFNLPNVESQDGAGAVGCGCERVFSENRMTASGWFVPIHATEHRESQYGVGIPPPVCVRVR